MDIARLEQLIADGRDSAMLRLALARALAESGRDRDAVPHLERAVELDPAYSAAWKELGRLRLRLHQPDAAAEAWSRGLQAARANGDKQAEKEMTVFLRRLGGRTAP